MTSIRIADSIILYFTVATFNLSDPGLSLTGKKEKKNLVMGQDVSTGAGRAGVSNCAGCDIPLPPTSGYLSTFSSKPDLKTICFWSHADSPSVVVGKYCFNLEGAGASYDMKPLVIKFARLFKYFKRDQHKEHWCSKCFTRHFPSLARAVFLELYGKGIVITYELELVKFESADSEMTTREGKG